MKKLYFILITILISAVSFGQELLINGGFESWVDVNTPSSYTLYDNVSQESTEINGGTYSAKLVAPATSKIQQTVSGIIPGTSYTISLWYKVESGDNTDARIWCFWRTGTTTLTDNANELRGPNNAYFDTNGNAWTQYSVTLTAPAGADNFLFETRTYTGATVYWDDFSFFQEAAVSPTLGITSPTNNSYVVGPDVDIEFSVQNFNVASGGTGDGYIEYTVDGGVIIDKFDTSSINLTGLTNGIHTVDMELVDNGGNSLSSPITATVTFTVYEMQTLPFTEHFDYTVSENLGDQDAWTNYFTGDEVIISSGSLSYSTLNGSGNSITFDAGGIDPVLDYTPTSSGSIYASFMLKVTAFDPSPVDGYFAVLRTDGGDYASRLWISPTSQSTYRIGVSNGATLTQINSPTTDYALDEVIFVVMNYDIDNDTVSAWANPALGGTEPSADISEASGSSSNTFTQFLIRQDSGTETPGIVMDELRIGTSWAVVTPSTLSVDNFDSNNFKVFPNPTSLGYINISSKSHMTMKVGVYDVLGKQVINETVSNNRLDVSNLNPGIYIMKISQDNSTTTKKLVIK